MYGILQRKPAGRTSSAGRPQPQHPGNLRGPGRGDCAGAAALSPGCVLRAGMRHACRQQERNFDLHSGAAHLAGCGVQISSLRGMQLGCGGNFPTIPGFPIQHRRKFLDYPSDSLDYYFKSQDLSALRTPPTCSSLCSRSVGYHMRPASVSLADRWPLILGSDLHFKWRI